MRLIACLFLLSLASILAHSQPACNTWLKVNTVSDAAVVGDIDVIGNQMTVEAMFNRTTPYTPADDYRYAGDIVSKHGNPSDCNYLLRPRHAEITTTDGFFSTPAVCDLELNKTYHVAMVYDGSTLKFYRNGFLLSQVKATGNLINNNWRTKIGDIANIAVIPENFTGYINEVKIWNVARTQAQLRAYINASLPTPTTQIGLQAYYTFNNLTNKQGNALLNGSLSGAAAINQTNPACNYVADSCQVIVVPPPATCVKVLQATYGGNDNDIAYDIVDAGNGQFYMLGNTNSFGAGGFDVLVVKMDASKTVLWSNTYGVSGNETIRKASPSADGGLLITGQTNSFTNSAGDILCMKIKPDGALQWVRTFGVGSANGDLGSDIIQTNDGGFAINCILNTAGFVADGLVIKLDANANRVWAKRFQTAIGEDGSSIIESGNKLIATFDIERQSGLDYAMAISELQTSNGQVLSTKRIISTSKGIFRPIIYKDFGTGYWISGHLIAESNYSQMEQVILHLNSAYNITKTYKLVKSPLTNDFYTGFTPLKSGGFITCASEPASTGGRGHIYKIAADGKVMFAKQVSTNGRSSLNALTLSGGKIIAVGSADRAGNPDFYLADFDSAGNNADLCNIDTSIVSVQDHLFTVENFSWTTVSDENFDNTPQNFTAAPQALVSNAICIKDSCVVNPPLVTCSDNIVEHIDLKGSEEVWASDVVFDSLVYIVGNVKRGGNDEAFIVKTGLEGNVIWTKVITGVRSDVFRFVKATKDGGCVAVGYTGSYGSPLNFGWLVVKLDKDGQLKWSRTFNTNSVNGNLALGVLECADGGFLISGNENSAGYKASGTLIKTDVLGNAQWLRKYELSEGVDFLKLYEINDGYIVMGQYLHNSNSIYRLLLIKVNKSLGDVMMIKAWAVNGLSPIHNSLYKRPGGYYASLTLMENVIYGVGNTYHGVLTLDENFNLEKSMMVGHAIPKNNVSTDMAVFQNGSIIGGMGGLGIDGDMYKINSSGILDWSLRIGGNGTQQINSAAAINKSNEAVFAGITDNGAGENDLLWIKAKMDATSGETCNLEASDAKEISCTVVPVDFSFDNVSSFLSSTWVSISPVIESGIFTIPYKCLTQKQTDFSHQQNICNPLQVKFFGSDSSGQIVWDFGDGSALSNQANPTHEYAKTGSFKVRFSLNGPCPSTIEKTIVVSVAVSNIIQNKDTVICEKGSVQLMADAAAEYCWTPATFLSNSSIANPVAKPSEDITYSLVSKTVGSNLVMNGDFSGGNTGFTSNYQYNSSGIDPASYFIGSDLNAWHPAAPTCRDHTSGNGKMMLVNGADMPGVKVWTETITVAPSTSYEFSCWLQHITSINPAKLQFSINGIRLGNIFNANSISCIWDSFSINWDAGNATKAEISIVNMNTDFSGNDFALDDISFAPITYRRDSVKITIDKPSIKTSNDTAVCAGSPVPLKTIGGATYSWSPAAGLSNTSIDNPIATVTNTTSYVATGTNAKGCIAKDTVVISIIPSPIINLSNDTAICGAGNVQLTASGAVSYQWFPATGLNNPAIANPLASPITTTKYKVKAEGADGCSATDSVTVHVLPSLVINVSNDTLVCRNSKVQLFATGANSYKWSPSLGLSNPGIANPIASPLVATKYFVTASNNQCSTTDSVTIALLPAPVVSLSADTAICKEGGASLVASGGISYAWSPSEGLSSTLLPSPIATPASTTKYKVTVIGANTCTATDSVIVSVLPPPVVILSKDTSICGAGSVPLMASGGISYVWSPSLGLSSSLIANPLASPTISTAYQVKVTGANTCTANGSVLVKVLPALITSISNDTAVCVKSKAQLVVTGGSTYDWTPSTGLNNAFIANPIASPTATTVYTVKITGANNCMATESVTVTMLSLPVIGLSNDTVICRSGSFELKATGGSAYQWSPAATLSNPLIANPLASPTVSTTYIVLATGANSCSVTDSVSVNVRPAPQFGIVNTNLIGCENQPIQLGAFGGDTYSWSPSMGLSNAAIANPIARLQTSQSFTVLVSENICKEKAIFVVPVAIRPLPAVIVSKSNDITCNTPFAQLNTNIVGPNYSWTPATGLSNIAIANPLANPATPTTYTVSVLDSNGCISKGSVAVKVYNNNDFRLYQMPNAFTPDRNGTNDCFGVTKWGTVRIVYFEIYNRWGQQVFAGNSRRQCWDGTLNGQPQPTGNFVYKIKVETMCGMVERAGSVLLIR